jgi:hypothetical protein
MINLVFIFVYFRNLLTNYIIISIIAILIAKYSNFLALNFSCFGLFFKFLLLTAYFGKG